MYRSCACSYITKYTRRTICISTYVSSVMINLQLGLQNTFFFTKKRASQRKDVTRTALTLQRRHQSSCYPGYRVQLYNLCYDPCPSSVIGSLPLINPLPFGLRVYQWQLPLTSDSGHIFDTPVHLIAVDDIIHTQLALPCI